MGDRYLVAGLIQVMVGAVAAVVFVATVVRTQTLPPVWLSLTLGTVALLALGTGEVIKRWP